MTARRVAIVPHTHWDREWYKSYQDFRLALVELIDTLIPLLEHDASYPHFMLDGQMAVVDDYLEVRPEAEERLRALAASGRVSMGPWYILMDEFLASGETIVRNLQMGIERGAAFGGVMDVGYLPDMFGHIAQMPQILRLAGFDDAVVWRGVPSQVTRDAFVWEAPDGSSVRAEYLPVGYSNGAALPDDAKALVRRTADHLDEVGDLVAGDLLYMNGSDHLMPQPQLGRVVAEANDLQDDLRFEVTSLADYLSGRTTEGLTVVQGELRSGFRANMLMGVTSNRVDVKRRGALAERELERRAEPLAALFQPPAAYPSRLLELAWREMVRNSAHDSICACSVDDVVDAVLHRYAEARAIAAGLADRSVKAFALSLAEPGISVLNPSARARSGVVELVVPADGPAPAEVQVISERSGLPGSMVLDANTVRTILAMLQGPKIDDDAWVHEIRIEDTDEGIDVTIAVGTEEKPDVPIAEAKQDLYTRLGAKPDVMVRVAMEQPSTRKIVARTGEVAGYGWSAFEPAELEHPVEVDRTRGCDRPGQRSGAGRDRPAQRDLRPRRRGRVRPAGRRRRPGRLLQLLAPATRLGRRDAGVGHRAGERARSCARPSPHHRHLRVAGSHRGLLAGAGRRTAGRRRHRRGAAGGRSRGAGHDVLRQPERGPPTARASPPPGAGTPVPRREPVHHRHPRPDRRGQERRVRAPDRTLQPLRDGRPPHRGPRGRLRVRARRHRR